MKNLLKIILLRMLLLSFGKQGVMCELSFSFAHAFNKDDFISTGKTSFTPDGTGVLLTTGGNFQFGRLFYKDPLQFSNSTVEASFTTFFSFQMISNNTEQGDGIAFFLMPSTNSSAGPGMYLGLVDRITDGRPDNHLFAVEFDSYANEDEQDLGQHIGIDVNGIRSVANSSLPSDLNFYSNFTLYAWIDYNGTSSTLQVGLSNTSFEQARVRILLHKTLDKDLADVLLAKSYIGFSASTGMTNDIHRVLSWNFSSHNVLRHFHAPRCRGICKLHLHITLPVVGVLFFVYAMVLLGYCIRKGRRILSRINSPYSLVQYSYSFLYTATKGFSDRQLLGRGGFGRVYKATTLNEALAVKVVGDVTEETKHQFVAELTTLGEYHHKNLVRLRGWCHAKRKLMLVYDYMSNGSVANHIFQEGSSRLLTSWSLRYGILQGVAEGVLFLHEGREECLLHRDIKAANVLLDSDFIPKLGDFGLARLLDRTECLHTMTRAGTCGYVAPEVVYSGRATTKSDVYGFGILSLEVVSGRRTLDARYEPDSVLLDWIWQMQEQGTLMETIDKRLKKFDKEQVQKVLHMALACCAFDSDCRPTMKECWEILNGTCQPRVPPGKRPHIFTFQRSRLAYKSSSSSSFETPRNSSHHTIVKVVETAGTTYVTSSSNALI